MNAESIKKFLYNTVISSMIFYLIATTISGIDTSDQILHWIMMVIVYSIALTLIKPVLKFLTLPSNFLFHWVAGSLLGVGAFYIMTYLLPGVRIDQTLINDTSVGIISISSTTLAPIVTMIIASICGAFINTLLYWLKKS